MKELSRITEIFTESVIREMTRICDAAGGINLAQGFPDFEAPIAIKEAAIKAINENFNQYAVTFGEPELRNAICKKVLRYNNIECNPDTDITVTCGATEAMIATLKAIINPGDEFIVFEPFYENYGPDGILSGATPKYVTLHSPDWSYNLDELSAAFNEKTKAIIINTPNNPTGKVFSESELTEIADLCQRHDVYAITDEIYEHILYDGTKHISIASLPGMKERTITINSVSKTYSVTGWRVGWAIAPKEITARIRKVHDFLTVGAPNPLQHAAAAALEYAEEYYAGLQSHYNSSREFLFNLLKEKGFKLHKPLGAYYMITDISDVMPVIGTSNDTDFCKKMIKNIGVAAVPGSSFFADPKKGSHLIRFCFCKKQETLDAVKKAFGKF